MEQVFNQFRESQYLRPLALEDKERFYLDLINIEQGMTGRADLLFLNPFLSEAVQLIINAIVLFEKGYFDCSFYSLRQSLELSTTIAYFSDHEESTRLEKLKKWKLEGNFPMHSNMINELNQRQAIFAEMKTQMSDYFADLDKVKNRLNKYVHKQGFDKFYVIRNTGANQDEKAKKLLNDFKFFLKKSIGAIAVFRLAIDSFPILLNDEKIYKRTGNLLTEGYRTEFIQNYIGEQNISDYKNTQFYKSQYDFLIENEEMNDAVTELIKYQYIDRLRIDEILSQKHLLSPNENAGIEISRTSEKVSKIYFMDGWMFFFTNTKSIRNKTGFSSEDFKTSDTCHNEFNKPYDNVFLSKIKIWDEDYFIEHNQCFDENEIALFNLASVNAKTLESNPTI